MRYIKHCAFISLITTAHFEQDGTTMVETFDNPKGGLGIQALE